MPIPRHRRDVLRTCFSLLLGLSCAGLFAPGANAQEAEKPALPQRPNEDTGWQNGGDYEPIGSPQALRTVKDRALKIAWQTFPPTLRTDGPNSNLIQTSTLHTLLYEQLVAVHPETEKFIPRLAKEWRVQTDFKKGHQTFWFRLNEKARFSTGDPVLAKDVQASWWHMVQEDRRDPSNMLVWSQFEEPIVVDERTIKVTTKKLNWRLFLYFGAGLKIFPETSIKIPGGEYLREYDWKFVPGSGPYVMDSSQLKKGESLLMVRRKDWWAENENWGKNTYNFELVKGVVVRDRELQYEKFKADEFDHYRVGKAQRWVEEIPKEDVVRNGWVKQRRIFNQAPQGFSGIAFNMRKKPFNDRRVRLAFAHLFNREKLNEKLFFNQYFFIDSFFPGRDWGNRKKNPKIRFDPDIAEELLFDAGYEERDGDGYLVDAKGNRLSVTLVYGSPTWQRIWLVVKEDFEDAGIEFKLQEIDATTLYKRVGERQFTLHFQSYSALLFPNPRTSWDSSLADQTHNNNIPGFKNEAVDRLIAQYDVTFDRTKQKHIIRMIDELVFKETPYALGWYAPYERVLFWDRFGHPDHWWSRIGQDPDEEILRYWWYDPAKMERLRNARANGDKLPQGQIDQKPWDK